jgi:hypothetical protein
MSAHVVVLMAAFVLVGVVFGGFTVSGQWRALAVRFAAPAEPPRGEVRFGFSSLRMTSGIGGIYHHCVTIGVSDRGISLSLWLPMRLFHPPLLIPWRSVRSCDPKTLAWYKGRTVNLGDGEGFWVQGKAAEAIGAKWDGMSDEDGLTD